MSNKTTMAFLSYIIKYFLLNIISVILPHPKIRAIYLNILGAKIGNNTRIENVKFIQVQCSLKNFRCGDNVFIGTGVTIDLSAPLSIGKNSIIAPGCSLITHQDAGEFNNSILSKLYPKKYLALTIKEEVWVGADVTILPGTIIESLTVIGAKSLVSGNIPGKVLAAGIPAKVKKTLQIGPSNKGLTV